MFARAAHPKRLLHDLIAGLPLNGQSTPAPNALVSRRLAGDDVLKILACRSQPQVAEWITRTAFGVEVAERFGSCATILIVEQEGRLIGDIMVRSAPTH